MNEHEEWRAVLGFPGYEVSSLGRVRSWVRSSRTGAPRILRADPNSIGYLRVTLCNADGKARRLVQHLVLVAFVGPRPAGQEARHFPDHDITNNRSSNLSWSSHVDNVADKKVHGTYQSGERIGSAKLRGGDARVIRMILSLPRRERPSQAAIGLAFGVHDTTISMIGRGEIWAE